MLTCYPGGVGAKPNSSRASVGESKRVLDSDDTSNLKLTLQFFPNLLSARYSSYRCSTVWPQPPECSVQPGLQQSSSIT